MQKPISMSMYANYLVDVGKLVYIIGESDISSHFKKLLESPESKQKIFYKCLSEVPPGTFKKITGNSKRKGIIRSDWMDKIIDKSPQMIIALFNCVQQLTCTLLGSIENEKWQDRLGIIIRKANKIFQILKSNNKEDIILKIIVIYSKNSGYTGNISQKIRDFLKAYERELHVIQSDFLIKDVQKMKIAWMAQLQKSYERKYKHIQKRMEQSFTERRIGCLLKLAILSQTLPNKNQIAKYDQVYQTLKFRFQESRKYLNDVSKFNIIKQIRTVADVVILRSIKVRLNTNKKVEDIIKNHLQIFKIRNINPKTTNYYIYSEELLWRFSYLQNLLEILHFFQEQDLVVKSTLAELVNAALTYLYYISQTAQSILSSINGKQVDIGQNYYLGYTNYLSQNSIAQEDIAFTKMKQIIEHKKDFIFKGIQLIVRYKSMKYFDDNEILFLNTYLLRFYLADGKFEALVSVYNELMFAQVKKNNYYYLNQLFREINNEIYKAQDKYKVQFYSTALVICEYFQDFNKIPYFINLLKQSLNNSDLTLLQPIQLSLKRNSQLFRVDIYIENMFYPLLEDLSITIVPYINKLIFTQSSTLQITFNNQGMKFTNIKIQQKINLKFLPFDYLKNDSCIKIMNIKLVSPNGLIWNLDKKQINYKKYDTLLIYSQIRAPEISIINPYKVCYINQTIPLKIQIQEIEGCQIQAKFIVKQQNQQNQQKQIIIGKTQIFCDLQKKNNLTNAKLNTNLQIGKINKIYMKLNKIGQKIIKFIFTITVKKMCQYKGDQLLKNTFTINKEISLEVKNLFDIFKSYKQTPSGMELKFNEIPINKKVSLHLKIQSLETIKIIQLSNNKNPKFFTFYKDILVKNTVFVADEKFKGILLFQVNQNQAQLFLATFFIKWMRCDLQNEIENVFVDDQIKITTIVSKVNVDYRCDKQLKKKKKSSLIITIRNLQNDFIHFYSEIQSTQFLMRIGQKGKSIRLGPKQCKSLFYDVLPVKAGYWKYPPIRVLVDGIDLKCSNQGNILFIS